MATLAGVGLAPETGGASFVAASSGLYGTISGGGQAATGFSQLNSALIGTSGPESNFAQRAAVASGPFSGSLVLALTGSMAYAERAASFESAFFAGNGLINSSGSSELIQGAVDAGLTIAGVADSGGCKE